MRQSACRTQLRPRLWPLWSALLLLVTACAGLKTVGPQGQIETPLKPEPVTSLVLNFKLELDPVAAHPWWVSIPLPPDTPTQQLVALERSGPQCGSPQAPVAAPLGGAALDVTEIPPDRRWRISKGCAHGPTRYGYRATLQLKATHDKIPTLAGWPAYPSHLSSYVIPTRRLPARSPMLRAWLRRQVNARLQTATGPSRSRAPAESMDVLMAIFSSVRETLSRSVNPKVGPDVLETLRTGEGSAIGLERVLVSSLRAAGIPARLVAGVDLRVDKGRKFRRWTEAYWGRRWWPLSAARGWWGKLPLGVVLLDRSPTRFIGRGYLPRTPTFTAENALAPLRLRYKLGRSDAF